MPTRYRTQSTEMGARGEDGCRLPYTRRERMSRPTPGLCPRGYNPEGPGIDGFGFLRERVMRRCYRRQDGNYHPEENHDQTHDRDTRAKDRG